MTIKQTTNDIMNYSKKAIEMIDTMCKHIGIADTLEPEDMHDSMMMDAMCNPDAFLAEIEKNHGVDSTQYINAKYVVADVQKTVMGI